MILQKVARKYLLPLLALMILPIALVACSTTEEPKPTIKFADTQFESLWINNAIAKFVIEKAYGYPVETIEMTTPIMQASLGKGDVHVMMELWQQNIQEWWDKGIAEGRMYYGGATYEGGPQFFAVPKAFADEYHIKTIDDMKKPEVVKALADPEEPSKGAFINCVIGWQCAEINAAKLRTYGLTEYYNIISPGSSGAMEAALAGAQKKGNPVFGYYWAPTALMGMYKWTIVEEPKYNKECWVDVGKGRDDPTYTPELACAYETLPVDKGYHKSLKTVAPELVTLLEKMVVGLQPINEVAAWAKAEDIQGEWEQAAVHYLKNYESIWTTWMSSDHVKKVKDALATQ